MGRGDIKTKKGKIFAGSFGKLRPSKSVKPTVDASSAAKVTPEKKAPEKKGK